MCVSGTARDLLLLFVRVPWSWFAPSLLVLYDPLVECLAFYREGPLSIKSRVAIITQLSLTHNKMDPNEQYKLLLSEIIAKQAVILGPSIAVLKARNVQGLEVDDKGKVIRISGDHQETLERLVDEYVNLSGQIVKNALVSVFEKYPQLRKV